MNSQKNPFYNMFGHYTSLKLYLLYYYTIITYILDIHATNNYVFTCTIPVAASRAAPFKALRVLSLKYPEPSPALYL